MAIIGPDYSDMIIATKKTDGDYRTKADGWEVYSHFTILFLAVIGTVLGGTVVIGIIREVIGWLIAGTVIGLGFWACYHYGTSRSVFDRWRYRTTPEQRSKIKRRLSGTPRKPDETL